MQKSTNNSSPPLRSGRPRAALLVPLLVLGMAAAVSVRADIPGRPTPQGKINPATGQPGGTAVPLPGTQQQELMNITFPSPYNVFEFPQTCGACHGGTIDQQAGHYGNWAGSVMGTTARNPVFRADWIVVNEKIKAAGAGDGAANICARCHIPNAFLSGRIDPYLGGAADGSTMIHQIPLSTDDEGISCEFCHRAIGNVVMKQVGGQHSDDPAFNMLKYITDWPHLGDPFPAAGAVRNGLLAPGELYSESPSGPIEGRPLGIATYQINDAMTYAGKYSGVVQVFFSDVPINDPLTGLPTPYTGQTYGIYPPGWPVALKTAVPPGMPQFNSLGQEIAYNADGSIPVHFEATIGPPIVGGVPRPDLQALSPEHSTHNTPGPNGQEPFIRTSEFCGTCHDRTLPPLDLGMPRAKEYTEWKLSSWGGSKFPTQADGTPNADYNPNYLSCQDCHMPTLKHEYSDTVPATLNSDPTVAGWSPYSKDRGPMGGTAFHKFGGANYNLAQMAKVLYPEVDLEVIGATTANDTRIFPGIQSSRDLSWDRNVRNDQITMRDAARIQVTQAPLKVGTDALGNDIYEVKVRVTDQSPHRFPTGLPDGRRAWINLVVKDALGATVYESGHYDANEAALYNDSRKAYDPAYFAVTGTRFTYAQAPLIDATSGQNAVMVYERRTGHKKADGSYQMSYDVSNIYIMFDNRIPPQGFSYAKFDAEGIKFRKFDPATFAPAEDSARFADGQYWDEVTYRFTAPAGATLLQARAELLAQTHTRDLMDFLRAETGALTYKGPRPEGPPSIFAANYPLTPTYLSDQVVNYWNAQPGLVDVTAISDISDLNGAPLDDTWAGVAYAAWLLSGKASPFVVGADDTAVSAAPTAPTGLATSLTQNPATGIVDPFTVQLTWDLVPNADGYLVWIRYGKSDLTASWDRLAIVYPPADATTGTFLNEGLNVAKTYGYKVQAFNGKGVSADSPVVTQTTPIDLPIEPLNLRVVAVADTTVTISWTDQADNEIGFIIERQDVPVDTTQPLPNFVLVATIPSQTLGPAFGGNIWTDTGLLPGRTYNYQVSAYNTSGTSVPSLPVAATTTGAPARPTALTAVVVGANQVDLTWVDNSVTETGFRIERSGTLDFAVLQATFTVGANMTTASDTTVVAGNTYYYRVIATGVPVSSLPSDPITVVVPVPPAAPSRLTATLTLGVPPQPVNVVTLTWTDNSLNEAGFHIYCKNRTGGFVQVITVAANATTWVDDMVQPNTTYDYQVASFNAAGESAPANAPGVVIPGQIPEAPTLLTASTPTKTAVTLTWVDNSANEQGFYVERSSIGPTAGFARVATVKANATSYKATALKGKTTYWFRVQAFNQNGVSAYTDPPLVVTTR